MRSAHSSVFKSFPSAARAGPVEGGEQTAAAPAQAGGGPHRPDPTAPQGPPGRPGGRRSGSGSNLSALNKCVGRVSGRERKSAKSQTRSFFFFKSVAVGSIKETDQ